MQIPFRSQRGSLRVTASRPEKNKAHHGVRLGATGGHLSESSRKKQQQLVYFSKAHQVPDSSLQLVQENTRVSEEESRLQIQQQIRAKGLPTDTAQTFVTQL
ncbi:hypothetical protein EYF80_040459 [Liparis tanakae]|uniref:Uncharacterized protein n=1 Tax=Liparis tanakae TaxID=230148 RepID=A0A4Z2G758_9TELE|nr:hypothetical protein EYF80_040459 [Liparis tanakae]